MEVQYLKDGTISVMKGQAEEDVEIIRVEVNS